MTEIIIQVDENTTMTQIIAADGMVLTNGHAYSKAPYLGVNDSPDNWHEITDAEYAAIQESMEEEPIDEIEQKAMAYDILMGVSE